MKKLLLTTALVFLALPAMAQDNMAGMKMDAPVLTPTEAAAALPEAVGKINTIDAEKHIVNLTHGPIDTLKWPSMTMDFSVAKDVDLSNFKVGDTVTFKLKKNDNSSYTIVEVNLTSASGDKKSAK